MESGSSAEEEHTLPLSSLRIMAPPMRLVSAAMWHVMQRKNALHYGKLEEFVTSVSEAVPGLLSYRHRAKLTLGLRARLILELCRKQDPPDPAVILPHLGRIQPPQCKGKRDKKVEFSVSTFQLLVQALLDSPAEREHFFKEVFVVEYGPQFDSALEKLLWEFLSRLDQLLPVPDLAQTVSWLSAAPSVLEDCAQPVSQPALLHTLLQHHQRLGHLNTLASLPSPIGDSILSSLSLPLSGRVRNTSQETNSLGQSGTGPDSLGPASLTHPVNGSGGSGSPIQPVIGLITSQDLPHTPSDGSWVEKAQATPIISKQAESGAGNARPLHTGIKLRSWASLDRGGAWQERAEKIEGRGGFCDEQNGRSKRRKREAEEGQARTGGGENRMGLRKSERLRTERRSDREDRSGVPPPLERLPQEGVGLSPLVISCLQGQPRVLLERLCLTDIAPPVLSSPCLPAGGPTSPQRLAPGVTEAASPRRGGRPVTRKRKLSSTVTPEKCLPKSSEKENCADSPLMWGASPVLGLRNQSGGRHSLCSNCDDDIIIDSEDEEMKNVKGRLFVKQYYRTKNNTFVPTLREFWGTSLA